MASRKSEALDRTVDIFSGQTDEESRAAFEADLSNGAKGPISDHSADDGILRWFQLDTGIKQDTQKVRIGVVGGKYALQVFRLVDGSAEPLGKNLSHTSTIMLTRQGWRNLVEAVRERLKFEMEE